MGLGLEVLKDGPAYWLELLHHAPSPEVKVVRADNKWGFVVPLKPEFLLFPSCLADALGLVNGFPSFIDLIPFKLLWFFVFVLSWGWSPREWDQCPMKEVSKSPLVPPREDTARRRHL